MKTQKVTQEKKTTFLLTDIYVANGSGLKYAKVMRLMNKNQSVEDNEHVKLILMVKSSLICFDWGITYIILNVSFDYLSLVITVKVITK